MSVASLQNGYLDKVWEIKTLGKHRDEEARKLLERASQDVVPIMRKRRWKVLLLSEFSPQNPSLLGLNIGGGREIRIRLRRHNNDNSFFSYEHVLGTMLHELTHNQCGPHDAKFYKLLDEITKECEDLLAGSFSANGRRMGDSHGPTSQKGRRDAAAMAAEKRAQMNRIMPSGGRRLGGDKEISNALSPIQAAAMAAERRLRDDLWCGGERQREATSTSGERQKAVEKGREQVGYAGGVSGRGGVEEIRKNGNTSSVRYVETRVGSEGGHETRGTGGLSVESSWVCQVCTLENKATFMVCQVCETKRPILEPTVTRNVDMQPNPKKIRMWNCKFCTLDNSESKDRCMACEQWRFSFGASSSTMTPYVGT